MELLKILLKTIIIPFYRSHAGLLFFVFFIMFGVVESGKLISYHRALIEGLLASGTFMLCVFAVWTFYSLKILHFTIDLLRQPPYQVVNQLALLSRPKVFSLILMVNGTAFLPVLFYSLFIYLVGITQQYYMSSAYVFLFQAALCFFNTWVILLFLRTQHVFTWLMPPLNLPRVSGRIGFYFSYFLQQEKIAIVLSKIFSLSLIYIVKENTSEGDDFRVTALTWLFVLVSHTFLVLKIRSFEDRYLEWAKALPASVIRIYLQGFAFYALLLMPEFMLLATDIGDTLTGPGFVMLTFFSGGFMMFIHAYLLKPNRDTDRFTIFLFWLFMASFVTILSKLTVLLSLALCLVSYLRMSKRYYQYQAAV